MTTSQNARVLIIDNDARVAQQLQPILERRNFAVKSIGYSDSLTNSGTNNTDKDAWLELIIDFARQFRPHVTVVDLRLRNDYMDEESGLSVIPKLGSAYNILYSARLTFDVFEQASNLGVFKCVAKGAGGTTKVVDAITTAAKRSSTCYADINIPWPTKWNSHNISSSILGRNTPALAANIHDDLVWQLYEQEANEATITDAMEKPDCAPPASIRRSAVLKVQPSDREPTILKLARSTRVQAERLNYEEYVEGQMRGAFHTRLVNSAIFWDIGGSTYSLISGQNICSFAAHYMQSADVDIITRPLSHLFEEVWRPHYEKQSQELSDTKYTLLYDLYDEMYKFDKRFTNRYELSLDEWHRPNTMLHPVEWIDRNKDQSRLPTAKIAVTHGDLHSENIFVDAEHAWLIDFERTGPGHILRDFVELEVDILTRLASAKIDNQSFCILCKLLVSSHSFSPSLYPVTLPSSIDDSAKDTAFKALRTILALRAIAHKLQLFRSVSEYRWALLFNALFVAHYDKRGNQSEMLDAKAQGIPQLQSTRSFIYATLICQYFEESS